MRIKDCNPLLQCNTCGYHVIKDITVCQCKSGIPTSMTEDSFINLKRELDEASERVIELPTNRQN